MSDAIERYGISSEYSFDVQKDSFALMKQVISGLQGIEQAVLQTESAIGRSNLGRAFGAIGQQASAGVGAATNQMRQVAVASKTVSQQLKPLKEEFRALRAEVKNINFGDIHADQQFKAATRQVSEYVNALKQLESQVSRDTSLEREFAAELKHRQAIAKTQIELVEQQRKAAVAAERLGGSQDLQSLGRAILNPLSNAGKDAIKILADFNDQMSQVQAVSGASARDLGILRKKAKDLGATTRFSASEAAEGLIFLSQAGYSATEQLAAIDGTLNLASAGALGLAEATDITVSTLGGFQLGAEAAAHAADVLAYTANAANTDVAQIGESMKYAGPPAKAFGASMEQTAAMIGLLSNAGIKGSQAGTALRAGFLRLAAPPKTAAGAISELGMSISDASGNIRPINEILGELQGKLGGVSQEKKIKLIKDLFGAEASSSFLYLVDNVDKLNAMTGAAHQSSEGLGEATKAARIMENNLGGSFRNFESAMEGFKIAFIEPLEPMVRFIVDLGSTVVNFLTGLPAPIRVLISLGGGLLTVLAALATVLGTAGVAFYGIQQAMATAQIGMLSLQRSAIPLTGFFETSMGAFQTQGIAAGFKSLTAELAAIPGPLGQATVAVRSFGMAALSFMISPLGLTIAGLFLLIKVLQKATPGLDLFGATIDLLGGPFKVLSGFIKGVKTGFEEAFGKEFQEVFKPVYDTFNKTFNELYDGFEKLTDDASKFGEVIGSILAGLFVPLLTSQAAIAQKIVNIWASTVNSILGKFQKWVRTAIDLGQMLVHALAENSPGPTFQIRQKWGNTIGFILDKLDYLVAGTIIFGNLIKKAFFFIFEGVAESFRTGLANQIVKHLINLPTVLQGRARNRISSMLAEIFTSPKEAETGEHQFFASIYESIWQLRERLTLLVPIVRAALQSIVPATLWDQGAAALLRFARLLNQVENLVYGNLARLGQFFTVTSRITLLLEKFPFISAGLKQALGIFGRFFGTIGLLLTFRDLLITLNSTLIGLRSNLDTREISTGWITVIINGLQYLINKINIAQWWLISFFRSLIWGDMTTLETRFKEVANIIVLAWRNAIGSIDKLFGLWTGLAKAVSCQLVQLLNHSASDVVSDAWKRATDWILGQWQRLVTAASWVGQRIADALADPMGFLGYYLIEPLSNVIKTIGRILVNGVITSIQQGIRAAADNLDALSGISLGVALLAIFFAPSGIAQIIASALPAIITALAASGVFKLIEQQLSNAFEWAVDSAFGDAEPKWVQRVRDVAKTLNGIFHRIGKAIAFTVQNPLAALAESVIVLRPLIGAITDLGKAIDQAGGITAVFGKILNFVVERFAMIRSTVTSVIGAVAKLFPKIADVAQQIVRALGDIPALKTALMEVLATVGKLSQSPIGQMIAGKLGAAMAVGMLAGKGAKAIGQKGADAAETAVQLVGNQMDRVIQLLLWIGQGVYMMAKPGVQAIKKLPLILQILQSVAGGSLAGLGALNPIGLISGLLGSNSKTKRITALDILAPLLPNALVPEEQRVLGPKVGGVLREKQPGFSERDPFSQREIIGSITKQLKPTGIPLISPLSPIFTPALIANVELFGGALISLTTILGGLTAALYIFKPELAKPLFAFAKASAQAIWGLAFVLIHLSRVVFPETADALEKFALKIGVPKWAIQTAIVLTQIGKALVQFAKFFVNTVDFVLGIVPTLIRSIGAAVGVALLGYIDTILIFDQLVLKAIRNSTKAVWDALVMGFTKGDWSALKAIAWKVGKVVAIALAGAIIAGVTATLIGLAPITMAIVGAVTATVWGIVEAFKRNLFGIATLTQKVMGSIQKSLATQLQRFTNWLDTLIHHPIQAILELLQTVKWVAGAIVAGLAAPAIAQAIGSIAGAVFGFIIGLNPVVAGLIAAVAIGIGVLMRMPGDFSQVVTAIAKVILHPIATLDSLITALQHPIDTINRLIDQLLHLITTPIKPTDWFFAPLADFLGSIGKWMKQWFPILLTGFLAFNVVAKGPIGGIISTFGFLIEQIVKAVKAVFSLVAAIVTLGKRTKDYKNSFEGQVYTDLAARSGRGLLKRVSGGRLGQSTESLDLQQERDRQFKQNMKLLQFQRKSRKLLGKNVTPEAVEQGAYDDKLQKLASKLKIVESDLPVTLRELAVNLAKKGEKQVPATQEIQEFQQEVIKALVDASKSLTQASESLNSVAQGLKSKPDNQRTLRNQADLLSIELGPKEIEAISKLEGGKGLRSPISIVGQPQPLSQEAQRIAEELKGIAGRTGKPSARLEDIPSNVVGSLARELGAAMPSKPTDEGYRFLTNYDFDKQGIQSVEKQLQMLQILSKLGQVSTPEKLIGGVKTSTEILRAIYDAAGDIENLEIGIINNKIDKGKQSKLEQKIFEALQQKLSFLDAGSITGIMDELKQDTQNRDQQLKSVRKAIESQIFLFLKENPVFTPFTEAAEELAKGTVVAANQASDEIRKAAMQTATAIEQVSQPGIWMRLTSSIQSGVQAIATSLAKPLRNPSLFNQEPSLKQLEKLQAARKAKFTDLQNQYGAGGATEFLKKAMIIRDPIEEAMRAIEREATQPQLTGDALIQKLVQTFSTQSTKDVMNSLAPEVAQLLAKYGAENNVRGGLEATIDDIKRNHRTGKKLNEFFNQQGIGELSVGNKLSAKAQSYIKLMQPYSADVERLMGGSPESELSPQVAQALKVYAKNYGISFKEFLDDLKQMSQEDVVRAMREAGAISPLGSSDRVAQFLRSVDSAPAYSYGKKGKDQGELAQIKTGRIAARIMKGDFSDERYNGADFRRILTQFARVGGLQIDELIDPSLTQSQLKEARQLRTSKLAARSKDKLGVVKRNEIPAALDIQGSSWESILSGRSYMAATNDIEKIIKKLEFKDRDELEQVISSIALLQEQRNPANLLKSAFKRVAQLPLQVTGISGLSEQFKYSQSLNESVGELESADRKQKLDAKQAQQRMFIGRQVGLQKALSDSRVSGRSFQGDLEGMGFSNVFAEFMKTGKWINKATSEQQDQIGKLFNSTPEKLQQLRKALDRKTLVPVFEEYLRTGIWAKNVVNKQKVQLEQILKSVLGIKPDQIEELQHKLKDADLTAFISAYLKTGEYMVKVTDEQKKAIAKLIGLSSEELDRLHTNLPTGTFDRLTLSVKVFLNGVSDQFEQWVESVRGTIAQAPFMQPVLKKVERLSNRLIDDFQQKWGDAREAFGVVGKQINKIPAIQQVKAARNQFQEDRGRSLQTLIQKAGYDSVKDFQSALKSRLEEKMSQGDAQTELLKVLSPPTKRGGLKSTAKPETIQALADTLKLIGNQALNIGKEGGYSTAGVAPFQIYLAKRFPKIVALSLRGFFKSAGRLSLKLGKKAAIAGVRRLTPFLARPMAKFSREIGHQLGDVVNRVREFMPTNRWLQRIEGSIRSRGVIVGKFFDQQASAIEALKKTPTQSLVQRVQSMLDAIEDAYLTITGKLWAGTQSARDGALSKLRNLGGWLKGVFGGLINSVKSLMKPIEQSMMNRMTYGSLQENRIKKQAFTAKGEIRTRTKSGAFVPPEQAVSTGYQRGLAVVPGKEPKRRVFASPFTLPPSRQLPGKTRLTESLESISRYFKGISTKLPEGKKTVTFERSVRPRKFEQTATGEFKSKPMFGDRSFVAEQKTIVTLAGKAKQTTAQIAQYFDEAALRSRDSWRRSGNAITGGWLRWVRRAIWTGANLVLNLNHSAADVTGAAWERNGAIVQGEMHQMAETAAMTSQKIDQSMGRAAGHTAGLFHKLGQSIGSIGKAGMAIGGVVSATGFAAQSIAFSLVNLGILDEKTAQSMSKFTELLSIVGAVGGLVSPLIGMVVSLGGAILSIGTALIGVVFTPIGLGIAGVVAAVLGLNWAINKYLGIDLLAAGFEKLAELLKSPFETALNWIEEKWTSFAGRFMPILSPLLKVAGDTGKELVSKLAENSPGPTFQIRQKWQNAIDSVSQSIQGVVPVAQTEGEKLSEALAPTVESSWQGIKSWMHGLGQPLGITTPVESVTDGGTTIGSPMAPAMAMQAAPAPDRKWWEIWKKAPEPQAPPIIQQDISQILSRAQSYARSTDSKQAITAFQQGTFRAPIGKNVATSDQFSAMLKTPEIQRAYQVEQHIAKAKENSGKLAYQEFGESRRGTIQSTTDRVSKLRESISAIEKGDHAGSRIKANFGDQKIGKDQALTQLKNQEFLARYEASKQLGSFQMGSGQKDFAKQLGFDPDGVEQAANKVLNVVQEFGNQWNDRIVAIRRGATFQDLIGGDAQELGKSITTLKGDIIDFGSRAAKALFKLDFKALGVAWGDFQGNFVAAAGRIIGSFGSMALSLIAFGVISIASLSPITLILIGLGLTILGLGFNFLGLRTIFIGVFKVLQGVIQILYGWVKGLGQIVQGISQALQGLFSADFSKMTEGFKLAFAGLQTIATNTAQGLRLVLGGAIQILQGLFQGLRQTGSFVLGMIGETAQWVKQHFDRLCNGINVLGNVLLRVLDNPLQAWNEFLGLLDKVQSKVRSVVKSATESSGNFLSKITGRNKQKDGEPSPVPSPIDNLAGPEKSHGFSGRANGWGNSQPLTEPVQQIESMGGAIGDTSDALLTMGSVMASVSPTLAAPVFALSSILDGITALKDAIPGLQGVMKNLRPVIQAAWGMLTGPLAPFLPIILGVIAGLTLLWLAFRNNFAGLKTAWYIVSKAFQDTIGVIWSTLVQLGNAILEPFEPLLVLFGMSGANSVGSAMSHSLQLVLNPILLIATGIANIIKLMGWVIVQFLSVGIAITCAVLAPLGVVIQFVVGLVQSVSKFFMSIGGIGGTLVRAIMDAFTTISGALIEFGNTILAPFEPILNFFGQSGAVGATNLLGNALKLILNPLMLINQVIRWVTWGFGQIVSTVLSLGTLLLKVLLAPLKPIVQGITAILAPLLEAVAIVVGGIALLANLSTILAVVSGVVGTVVAWVAGVPSVLAAIGAVVMPLMTGLLGAAMGFIAPLAGAVIAFLAPIAPLVLGVAAVFLALQTNFLGIRSILGATWGIIVGILQGVVAIFSELFGTILTELGTVWNQLVTSFSTLGAMLIEPFKPILALFGGGSGGDSGFLAWAVQNTINGALLPLRIIATVLTVIIKLISWLIQGLIKVGEIAGTVLLAPFRFQMWIVQKIRDLIAGIGTVLVAVGQSILSFILAPFQMVWGIVQSIVSFFGSLPGMSSLMGQQPKPAQPQKFASGGLVQGPGSGTSDRIPAMLSNGEFVMRAAATRMFMPWLNAMNQGQNPIASLMGGMQQQQSGFVQALMSGMPAEAAMQLIPIAPPSVVPPPLGQVVEKDDRGITVNLNLTFGDIIVNGSGAEAGQQVIQQVTPEIERVVRDALHDLVEKMR
jgi:TP901 family phage tail tape measure protein